MVGSIPSLLSKFPRSTNNITPQKPCVTRQFKLMYKAVLSQHFWTGEKIDWMKERDVLSSFVKGVRRSPKHSLVCKVLNM